MGRNPREIGGLDIPPRPVYTSGMSKITVKPLSFFQPLSGAGKWHVSNVVGNVAACGCGALLDKSSGHRIQLNAGTDIATVHPICCRLCLKGDSK